MASKYKKNKVKFKWTKELLVLILGLLAIIGATIALSLPTNNEKITTEINDAIIAANSQSSSDGSSTSYSSIPTDNVYESISHKKLLKKIAKEEYVYVLYGSKNSSIILENASKINTIAVSEEIDTIYVYSSLWVEEAEDTNAEAFKSEKKVIEDDLNANKNVDVEAFSVLNYPALLVFHNGSLIFNSQEYDDKDYVTWNMYIQKALYISKQ